MRTRLPKLTAAVAAAALVGVTGAVASKSDGGNSAGADRIAFAAGGPGGPGGGAGGGAGAGGGKGVGLGGQILDTPEPEYPPIARAAKADGMVSVRVTVDERGNVVAAEAVSGHPLLLPAAVAAAREAKFKPTLVDGKPVKVSGAISYNFTLK
jgi:protein TonB